MGWFAKEKVSCNEPAVPETVSNHPAWLRLVGQIDWYDKKSVHSQRYYKLLKLVQIVVAISIPVISHADFAYVKWVISGAGALIAILESIQHMNQYSTLWVTYRSTAEKLKHEKYLFLSEAGPYRGLDEPSRLIELAERVEEHVSTEHANWINETRKAVTDKRKNQP